MTDEVQLSTFGGKSLGLELRYGTQIKQIKRMFAAAARGATFVIALVFNMHTCPESSILEIFAVKEFSMTNRIVAALLFRWTSNAGYEMKSRIVG